MLRSRRNFVNASVDPYLTRLRHACCAALTIPVLEPTQPAVVWASSCGCDPRRTYHHLWRSTATDQTDHLPRSPHSRTYRTRRCNPTGSSSDDMSETLLLIASTVFLTCGIIARWVCVR